MIHSKRTALIACVLTASLASFGARADGAGLKEALSKTKPLIDLRLRVENVDQDPLVNDAEATTFRARLGFETGKFGNTSLLVEGEAVMLIQNDYRPDPAVPTMTTYPVVPDPEAYELNRFQITNTSLPGTTLTLGRQRIALDDQRFVGPVGWRQNEQTFDALRVVNKSVKNLVLDATFFNRVNRIFGKDSPQGVYEGDSGLFNAGYQTKIGKISGFAYLLDFESVAGIPAAVRDSTSTYGLRFAGEKPVGKVKLAYLASYATQTDYADNPLDFDLAYRTEEISVTFGKFTFGVGEEVFEGNGVKGFTTPLATLHKFQGWADKFLATPPNGIEDRYVNFGAGFKAVGPFETLGMVVSYHDYNAERIDAYYGDEINVSLAVKHKKLSAMLKFADYEQGALATARDTQKLWAQVEFVW
ncbi:MAG: alginate export family protein [Steroidobacteraceae bacterium]|nr:alginate export family protein [Steroidobacteraceae bacterium]